MEHTSSTQECLEAFFEFYDVDKKAALVETATDYVLKHVDEFDGLVEGYVAMAPLNVEICAEFTACESEAYNHFC